jgi:thymidylate synthase (FAD)
VTIIEPVVSLEWATPNPAKFIELAARTCYKSVPGDKPEATDEFVRRIAVNQGHASVIEHVSASLRFLTDRGITHEIVRHRLASYSQESTRYVNYLKSKHGGGDLRFILPLDLTHDQRAFFLSAYTVVQNLYNHAIDIGMTPQQARDILPNGVKTEIVMTANAREWLHFLKLRTSKAAHPKMRVVAKLAGHILAEWCPCLFSEYAEGKP